VNSSVDNLGRSDDYQGKAGISRRLKQLQYKTVSKNCDAKTDKQTQEPQRAVSFGGSRPIARSLAIKSFEKYSLSSSTIVVSYNLCT